MKPDHYRPIEDRSCFQCTHLGYKYPMQYKYYGDEECLCTKHKFDFDPKITLRNYTCDDFERR